MSRLSKFQVASMTLPCLRKRNIWGSEPTAAQMKMKMPRNKSAERMAGTAPMSVINIICRVLTRRTRRRTRSTRSSEAELPSGRRARMDVGGTSVIH